MKKFFILFILITLPASAESLFSGGAPKAPIQIDADALEVMQQENIAVFTGNVIAKQGDMDINADRMTVHYKPGGGDQAITKIEVAGNVFLKTPTETAKGGYGVFDTINDIVTLAGDVTLTRDSNILKGSKLVFNIATGQSKLTREEGQRVRGLFVPQ